MQKSIIYRIICHVTDWYETLHSRAAYATCVVVFRQDGQSSAGAKQGSTSLARCCVGCGDWLRRPVYRMKTSSLTFELQKYIGIITALTKRTKYLCISSAIDNRSHNTVYAQLSPLFSNILLPENCYLNLNTFEQKNSNLFLVFENKIKRGRIFF